MKTLIIFALILLALLTALSNSQSNITYNAGTTIDVQSGADVCADAIIITGSWTGGGTICTGALPVELVSFNANVTKNNVKLIWVTDNEINNAGFDIERSKAGTGGVTEWTKIDFVQGNGTTQGQTIYTYEDKKLQPAVYKYRLKQIDFNGNFERYELNSDVMIAKPGEFLVGQNYPNPSNPKSKIDFEIPEPGKVTIKIYNILGQEAAELMNETKDAGYYTVEFDGSNLSSGVYFYMITSGKFTQVKKMMLIK